MESSTKALASVRAAVSAASACTISGTRNLAGGNGVH